MRDVAPLVVMAGGGTGGHLYPALAIADALRESRPDVHVFFVGARRGLEARVLPERGEEHLLLSVYGIDRKRPLTSWRALTGLAGALLRVVRLFLERRPEVVVVTGGYASAPAGIVAGLMGIPLVLQEQNSVPGAVTRLLTRFAQRIHVAYPEAIRRLPTGADRCVVTGNPVRPPSTKDRTEAREQFGVPVDVLLVFVTGGSQGSLALNRGVTAFVEGVERGELHRPDVLHLLWSTGRKHFDTVEAALASAGRPAWVHAVPYVDDMPAALSAADVALSRAGAMTTAELVNQGLPAILVPLPTAAEDHQMHNARALEAAGAARVIPEADLTPGRLASELQRVASGPDDLRAMGEQARRRARPHATREIAADVATFLPPLRRAA
ncbi:MAG: undecaprenyldiphospho-muramoylpentapeptide beta-N-acetylglucosaminyltransferase [Longimicrobiales bacterium]|nr:undecaprenyldiphospho-muramoylpentapeptide beta-N-acetylglucosaminyltransferase [Longimicrobiales bacterium]